MMRIITITILCGSALAMAGCGKINSNKAGISDACAGAKAALPFLTQEQAKEACRNHKPMDLGPDAKRSKAQVTNK
jgi:uncharacterized protein YceK